MQFSRSFFNSLLFKLRHYSHQSEDSRDELTRAIFCLQLIVTIFVIVIPFFFIALIFQPLINAIMILVIQVVFAIAYFMMRKGLFVISKFFLIIVLSAVVFINGSTHGKAAGFQFLWCSVICGSFMLFSFRRIKQLVFSVLVTIIFFAFAEYTDYSLLLIKALPESSITIMYYTCLVSGVCTVIFFYYYLLNLYYKAERKQQRFIEKLKNRNDSLKKINNELDSFVYRASHDLRAPLSSLMALVNLAKSEPDMKMLKEYIFHQEKSIKKLDAYIVDILNLSKNARKDIESLPINLKELLEDLLSQYAFIPNFESIEKIVEINEDVPLYSDRKRLMIIMNNLISNALRYSDPSKKHSYLEIKATIDKTKAVIVVHDNGVGIERKHLARVFQMFYRASHSSEGSGLGLYLVKETVDKLGGKISIDSEEKGWTSFTIVLPNLISK